MPQDSHCRLLEGQGGAQHHGRCPPAHHILRFDGELVASCKRVQLDGGLPADLRQRFRIREEAPDQL
jgi:hypothetical protein